MANPMKSVVKPVPQPAGLEAALEGARRASADAASSAAPAQPEVVAIARRRQFSASEKRRILAEADRCSEPGQIGALLRRCPARPWCAQTAIPARKARWGRWRGALVRRRRNTRSPRRPCGSGNLRRCR